MSIGSKILRLGLPILIGQLGTIVVAFADTTMVGHYSTESLASASFVNNLFNVVMFALLGFAYGLTPLVGALFSKGESRRIGKMVCSAVAVNVIFALFLTVVMTVVYFNVERMGQPSELMPLIKPYFLIVMGGMIPLQLFNVFAQWSYAINRTKMPMWIILSANILNIVGNYLLIGGRCGFPEMGLMGAGVATFASRMLCALAIMAIFFFKREYGPYREGFFGGGSGSKMMVCRKSIPVSLQMSFESGSFTFAAIMSGWIGAVSLAAFQVVVILGTLGFCVYYSLAAALSVLVSNASGLGDAKLMRRTSFVGYRIMLAVATLSSLVFVFCGPVLMRFFTDDPAVVSLALTLIVPLVLYQYGDATQITFANALRGTSNVMPMVWISFVSYVVVGIPATWALGFPCGLGIYGIILSFSVSLFLAAALFLYEFLRTTRRGVIP